MIGRAMGRVLQPGGVTEWSIVCVWIHTKKARVMGATGQLKGPMDVTVES